MNIESKPCEDKGPVVHMAEVLDRACAGTKAEWLATVTGIGTTVLSEMRHGKRRIPAVWVPLIDRYLGTHALLEALALMEGCTVSPINVSPMSAADLERLFPQILREEGHANADIAEAMADGEIDATEAEHLEAHFAKLALFFADARERMAARRAS